MTYITIQQWGDFNIKTTYKIMFSEEQKNVRDLTKKFCERKGLQGLSGVPMDLLHKCPEEFCQYLRKEGFKEIKTNEVSFSD